MANDVITEMIAKKYLNEMIEKQISTIILGCTHYPVIKSDLKKVLGDRVNLVESGDVLSAEIEQLFDSGILIKAQGPRTIRVCITDLTDHFERLAHQLMAPESIGELERVVL